ncbi:hypothetical protein BC831DRAFT_268506 [Entophlyctis helioformis]|nr:hypothetical protein BC831DRAFT_268506 [Entophlyctis helioformis]
MLPFPTRLPHFLSSDTSANTYNAGNGSSGSSSSGDSGIGIGSSIDFAERHSRQQRPHIHRELLQTLFEKLAYRWPLVPPAEFLAEIDSKPPFVIHALHAVACTYLDKDGIYGRHKHHYTLAKEHLGDLLAHPSTDNLYGVITMFVYAATHALPDIVLLLGIAARMVHMLGMHVEDPEEVNLPSRSTQHESRRRMFWWIYDVDALTSIVTELPCSINDDDVLVGVASTILYRDQFRIGPAVTSHVDPFEQCDYGSILTRLLNRIVRFTRQNSLNASTRETQRWLLDRSLTACLSSYPSSIARMPDNSRTVMGTPALEAIFVELKAAFLRILLHEQVLPENLIQSPLSALENPSVLACRDAAMDIQAILEYVHAIDPTLSSYLPHTGRMIAHSCAVLIAFARSPVYIEPPETLLAKIQLQLMCVKAISDRWMYAKADLERLQRALTGGSRLTG